MKSRETYPVDITCSISFGDLQQFEVPNPQLLHRQIRIGSYLAKRKNICT